MTAAPVLLDLRDLRYSRGSGAQRYSLEVPRLTLREGEQWAVLGLSGSGKSTLLDILAMATAPQQVARFEYFEPGISVDIAQLWREGRHDRLAQLRSRLLGYVLQTGGLLDFIDVRSNIGLSREWLGLPDDGSVERLAEQLDIGAQLRKKPSALSVGQRQRVSFARALAHNPRLLLADEPTAALDPLNAARVLQLLLARGAERGACSVIATHDRALAEQAGLRILQIELRRDADDGVTATLSVPA